MAMGFAPTARAGGGGLPADVTRDFAVGRDLAVGDPLQALVDLELERADGAQVEGKIESPQPPGEVLPYGRQSMG